MPLYEFYCKSCGLFEQMVSLNEAEGGVCCPKCEVKAKHIFSPPSFTRVFSGTRHTMLRRAEKGREPRVVRRGEGDPLEATLPKVHKQKHGHLHSHGDPSYPPWMIKH